MLIPDFKGDREALETVMTEKPAVLNHNTETVLRLQRDIRTISEQAGFLMQKTAFLLDAMMGFINIEQSAITKMFSIVAVIFLPPTLFASIYGMNFAVMPELQWAFGYPAAVLLMVGSGIASLLYFRWKGWF